MSSWAIDGRQAVLGGLMLGSTHPIRAALAVAACLALAASACGDDSDDGGRTDPPPEENGAPGDGPDPTDAFFGGHQSEVYSDDAHWLCKPGIADDVCERDLDATVVYADGTTEVEPHQPAEDPAVDCFYVYPTVNIGGPANADLEPAENAEIFAAYIQAARLTSVCRVFAPVYRQAAILGDAPEEGVDPWTFAYEDVLDAFKHYIDNESAGRDFVLVGHSQGSSHLIQLIAEEIDGEPALLDRMVSAFPIGWSINVPLDGVVGGAFQNVPVCEAPDQTGCVIGYSSYRAPEQPGESPAGEEPLAYGEPREEAEGMSVVCANPASLEGGAGFLTPYFAVEQAGGAVIGDANVQPFADPARTEEITTPFVTYPDLLEAECVYDGQYSYLAVTVHADPKEDVRTHDIYIDQSLFLMGGDWGLHVIDVDLATGDIVDVIATQAATR